MPCICCEGQVAISKHRPDPSACFAQSSHRVRGESSGRAVCCWQPRLLVCVAWPVSVATEPLIACAYCKAIGPQGSSRWLCTLKKSLHMFCIIWQSKRSVCSSSVWSGPVPTQRMPEGCLGPQNTSHFTQHRLLSTLVKPIKLQNNIAGCHRCV